MCYTYTYMRYIRALLMASGRGSDNWQLVFETPFSLFSLSLSLGFAAEIERERKSWGAKFMSFPTD